MCDNSRECAAAKANGFGGLGTRRPLDDAPDTTPEGPAPESVRPGWSAEEPTPFRLVAVPCESGRDLDVERSAHFGRAPMFALVRIEADGQIGGWWLVENPTEGLSGHGMIAVMLAEEGVTDVVTAGIGAGMYQRLMGSGIRVWREQDAATVATAIRAFVDGECIPVAEADLREGHGA